MKLCETKEIMDFGNDRVANFYKKLAIFPTWLLSKTPITGNQVTTISLIFLIVGGVYYFDGKIIFGFMFMFIYNLLDYVDGSIARYHGSKSLRGRFLDSMCHQLAIPIITLGIGFYLFTLTNNILYLYLGISGSIFSMFNEITRLRHRIVILEKTENKSKHAGEKHYSNKILKLFQYIFNFPIEFSIYFPIFFYLIDRLEYVVWIYGILMPIRWLIIFYTDSKFDESQMIK